MTYKCKIKLNLDESREKEKKIFKLKIKSLKSMNYKLTNQFNNDLPYLLSKPIETVWRVKIIKKQESFQRSCVTAVANSDKRSNYKAKIKAVNQFVYQYKIFHHFFISRC